MLDWRSSENPTPRATCHTRLVCMSIAVDWPATADNVLRFDAAVETRAGVVLDQAGALPSMDAARAWCAAAYRAVLASELDVLDG